MTNNPIKNFYSEIYKKYELANHLFTFGLDILWRKKAVKIAAEGGGDMWLDVCSGTGETAFYLKKLAPKGTTIISTDFSAPMMKIAMAKDGREGIDFAMGDANMLPYKDASFDLITISFATRNLHINQDVLVQCFKEFRRVLKPAGRFVNLETSQPKNRWIRAIFHKFVGLLVRPIGKAASGFENGYKYLSNSIQKFYGPEELSELLKESGFSSVSFKPLMFGAVAIHKAVK